MNGANEKRLTFLGTGTSTGVPVIGCTCETCTSADARDQRLRTSAMIELEEATIVIDAGPDFRAQMLKAQRLGCRTDKMAAILVTHEHYDHVGGLDDVRGLNYMMRRPIDIYAQTRVIGEIKQNLRYVFTGVPYPGTPKMSLHAIEPMEKFSVGGMEITPLPIMHDKLPIVGYKIGGLAYITDASMVPEETMAEIRGIGILVINALGPIEHHSHLSLQQAIDISEKVGARETYFTHIGHKMGLYEKTEPELPSGCHLAYDGLQIRL